MSGSVVGPSRKSSPGARKRAKQLSRLVELRFFGGLTVEEVAEVAWSSLFRSRAILRCFDLVLDRLLALARSDCSLHYVSISGGTGAAIWPYDDEKGVMLFMNEANESRYRTGDTLGDALRFLCDASCAVLPRDVAHKLGEFEKNFWGGVRWFADKKINWIDEALHGGDRLREEWTRRCHHDSPPQTATGPGAEGV